ncbi:hypothetical protein ACFQMF_02570 [Halorubrum rutilum]|uniref:Uncharacterized protein n=1 Tax=Halorubrum rutilum TaxID=1364933 RepID=A0ABD6AGV8_9EURY|nr:hypothetical protein [Halorubrum rutilum]
MDDSIRRRLDAIVALLSVIATVAVTALLLSFGGGAIGPFIAIAFVGALVSIFVDAELY